MEFGAPPVRRSDFPKLFLFFACSVSRFRRWRGSNNLALSSTFRRKVWIRSWLTVFRINQSELIKIEMRIHFLYVILLFISINLLWPITVGSRMRTNRFHDIGYFTILFDDKNRRSKIPSIPLENNVWTPKCYDIMSTSDRHRNEMYGWWN